MTLSQTRAQYEKLPGNDALSNGEAATQFNRTCAQQCIECMHASCYQSKSQHMVVISWPWYVIILGPLCRHCCMLAFCWLTLLVLV